MVPLDIWQKIRHLNAEGWSQRRIARELGLSRNTVKDALAAERPPGYTRARGPSPLAPWQQLVERGVRRGLSGARVLDDLQQAGYQGSRSSFYEQWAAVLAELKPPKAACRFETGPGEQAQFDWAVYNLCIAGQLRKVFIYSLILGFSRRLHWFPSLADTQEAVFEGIEAGWWHFGGVCRYLHLDNARVFVSRRRAGEVEFNANFLRLCGHYRVQPIAGRPHHPQGKGKVEHPFGPLERRLLQGREWNSWSSFQSDLAAHESRWEQRIHGTTKVSPRDRFEEERSELLPLPRTPFLQFVENWRQVSGDCLISYLGVKYCVPWPYAGKRVLVRSSQGRELIIYSPNGQEIRRHELRPSGSPPVFCPEDYEGLRRRHSGRLPFLTEQFRRQYGSSESAEVFLQRLIASQRQHPAEAVGRVLALLSGAPSEAALLALADAVEFNLCTARFLEERLRQRSRGAAARWEPPEPPQAQLLLPQLEVERSLSVYGRALDPTGEGPAQRER